MRSSQEALALAQRLSHTYTFVYALEFAARFRLLRREAQPALNLAEVEMTHARAWVCEVAGRWNSPAGLGLDPAGRGRGRPHAAAPSGGHLTGARGKLAAGRGVCHAGRGIGERRTHRRGTGHTDRSSGESAQKRGVPLRSRIVSTQRGVASPGWQEPRGTGEKTRTRGRGGVFSAGHRRRSPSTCEVAGAKGRDEFGPSLATTG